MKLLFVTLAFLACSANAFSDSLQRLRERAQQAGGLKAAGAVLAAKHVVTAPDFITEEMFGENLTEKLFITEPGLFLDPTPYGHRYQRKEVREMTDEQWQQFVDALWKMKLMEYGDLVKEFGTDARPYDFFPAKHTWALLHHPCPTPAYSSVFLNFHRAMVCTRQLLFVFFISIHASRLGENNLADTHFHVFFFFLLDPRIRARHACRLRR
jgi:hypothetical protein